MRKKIICILLIIFAVLNFNIHRVYAAPVTKLADKYSRLKLWFGKVPSDSEALAYLNGFGYEGDTLHNEMKIISNIEITENNNKKYKIKIGNQETDIESQEISENDLKNIFGYDGENNKWQVLFVIEPVAKVENVMGSTNTNTFLYKIKAIYHDVEEGKNASVDNSDFDLTTLHNMQTNNEISETVYNTGANFILGLKDFKENFKHNAPGTIGTLAFDVVRTIFGDVPQILINLIENIPNGLVKNGFQVAFKYSKIPTEVNKQIKQAKGGSGSSGSKHQIIVKNKSEGFDIDTEIPYIPVDLYSMAKGDISFFDVDFLAGQKDTEKHPEKSIWVVIRNFATLLMRVTMYVAAAFLLTTLIWHGIHIVRGSIDNPMAKADHRRGLNDFITSVLMLIGVVVIMAIGIFANRMFANEIKIDEEELPIRVIVMDGEDTEGNKILYSFSTNATGYVRYMAQIENVDLCSEKLLYTLVYIILVWLNVFGAAIMTIRFLGMLGLSIIGPIIAAQQVFRQGGLINMRYSDWATWYLVLAGIQIIFTLSYNLLLQCAFQL